MTAVDTQKDLERAILTVTAEYPATVEQVWQLWSDPRRLERWWGPPTHPATVVDHALEAGGTVRYFMTGPEGEKFHGGWRVIAADEPHRIEFEDFFADDNGEPVDAFPVSSTTVSIEDATGATRMTIETRYESREAMQQVLDMGLEEGLMAAMSQIDPLLAELSNA